MSYEAYKELFDFMEDKGEISVGKYQLIYSKNPYISSLPPCIDIKEDGNLIYELFNDRDMYEITKLSNFSTLTDFMEDVKHRKRRNDCTMTRNEVEVLNFLQ